MQLGFKCAGRESVWQKHEDIADVIQASAPNNSGIARSNFASDSANDNGRPNGSCGGRCVKQPQNGRMEANCGAGIARRVDATDLRTGGYSGEPLLCKLRPVGLCSNKFIIF